MSTIDQARPVADDIRKRPHPDDEVAGPMLASLVWFVLVVIASVVFPQPGA